jgi:hypothetical protein
MKKNKKDYFAEIIESNLETFLAQCWEWNFFPEFGSLVQVQNETGIIFGLVTQIKTGSMDPMRYPFPYQKTEEELRTEQPQIFEFLKTTFKAHIVGFKLHNNPNKIWYNLPTKPCKIHAFIKHCSSNLSNIFFKKFDFLHLLFEFSTQIPNLNELLLTILNNLSKKNHLNQELMNQFCQTMSLITGNDYRHLKLFLKRVEGI